RLLGVAWRSTVDAPAFVGVNRTGFVDRLTQHVHDATQGASTYRYRNRRTGIGYIQATLETFGRTHGDGTDNAVAQLLLDFQGSFRALYFQRVINVRYQIARKFHVDNGADDLNDTSATHVWFLRIFEPFLNRGSAADDFRNFLRDRRLTSLVVDRQSVV